MTTLAPSAGFTYEPPVGPEVVADWQARLEAAVPRSERAVSHLRLVWEAGDPWEPVGRWFLYDCTPRVVFEESATRRRLLGCTEDENADAVLLRDLDGPSPRDVGGYYDAVLKTFVQDVPRNCTLTQWTLWQKEQVYGLPFWVIQGAHGGHQWRFTQGERRALKMLGRPTDPPRPGALPYAPFSERTLDKVLAYDRLRGLEATLSRDRTLRERKDLIAKARKDYLALLTDQVAEIWDEVARPLKSTLPAMPDAPKIRTDFDAADDAFIHRD